MRSWKTTLYVIFHSFISSHNLNYSIECNHLLYSLTSWTNSRGEEKQYPADFGGVLSKVEIYQCPDSGKRVMISNGIPDHKVTLQKNNAPCEVNWVVEVSAVKRFPRHDMKEVQD